MKLAQGSRILVYTGFVMTSDIFDYRTPSSGRCTESLQQSRARRGRERLHRRRGPRRIRCGPTLWRVSGDSGRHPPAPESPRRSASRTLCRPQMLGRYLTAPSPPVRCRRSAVCLRRQCPRTHRKSAGQSRRAVCTLGSEADRCEAVHRKRGHCADGGSGGRNLEPGFEPVARQPAFRLR
jgi:hypothetical protein